MGFEGLRALLGLMGAVLERFWLELLLCRAVVAIDVGKGIFFALLLSKHSYRAIRKVNGTISSPAFAERSNNLSATTAWRSRTEKSCYEIA